MAGALSGGRRGLPRVCPRVVAEVWVPSFRANLVVTVALFVLMVTFVVGAGTYRARTGLVHLGGYLGLVTAALSGYLAAGASEATDGRSILAVWPLANPSSSD